MSQRSWAEVRSKSTHALAFGSAGFDVPHYAVDHLLRPLSASEHVVAAIRSEVRVVALAILLSRQRRGRSTQDSCVLQAADVKHRHKDASIGVALWPRREAFVRVA